MTTTGEQYSAEITQCGALLAGIDATAAPSDAAASKNRRGARSALVSRRRVTGVAIAVLLIGALAGVAGASPSASTTNVTFVPLTVGHKVLNNATIAANKTNSPVVIGASTTVPSNATTVQLTVTAKGAASGVLTFYPAGNSAGGSGQTLPYPGGNVVVSSTIEENVGQSGELTFANSGSGSAVVTATLIGYSTQVTAGDITGTGGSAGQVLTDTGSGASWQTPGHAYAEKTAYTSAPLNQDAFTTIVSVSVPAGSYEVSFTTNVDATSSGPDRVACYLYAPNSSAIGTAYGSSSAAVPQNAITTQGLLTTSGGTIFVTCIDSNSTATTYYPSLIATAVGSVTGAVAH